MNRRDFVRLACVGLGSGAGGMRASAATGRDAAGASAIAAVVYDERYGDARAFAEALASMGAVALAVRGDCAPIWYGALAARLQEKGARVAGLTTETDLLIARGRARELRLAPLFEGHHDARGADQVRHRLSVFGDADGLQRKGVAPPRVIARQSLPREAGEGGRLALPSGRVGDAGRDPLPSQPRGPLRPAHPTRPLRVHPPLRAGEGLARPASVREASPTKLAHLIARLATAAIAEPMRLDMIGPRAPDHPGYLTSWLFGS